MLLRDICAMDSVSAAKKGIAVMCRDMISELPDEILIHILSFVFSAKDVKRTCILSKRWRNIWAFVPSLEFCHKDFFCCKSFVDFVDNFLQLRNPLDLHAFSLDICCLHKPSCEEFKEWICYAIRSNVKVLNFCFHTDDDNLQFPNCIFSCPSLEELSLKFKCVYFEIDLKPPKFVDLGQLKTLHLEKCNIGGKPFKMLISACPCLEDLHLRYCTIDNFQLSSDTITRLIMYNCWIPKIQISIPSLISFDYYLRYCDDIILLDNLPDLVSASIKYDDIDDAVNNPKLIEGLSSATTLDIFVRKYKRIPEAKFSKLPIFHNLRCLKLGGSLSKGNSQILAHFLRCSPKLEVLRLEYPEICQLPKLGEVGFDCPCLARIEIHVRRRDIRVHKLVKFLQEHAKKLLEINIIYAYS